ncbi:hypothetical protein ACFFRR_007582 [Megaselia abdita]
MVNKTIFCSICKCKPLFFYELHHFEGFSVEDLKKFLCKFAGFDYFVNNKKIQFCLNCKDKVESAVFLLDKLVLLNPNKNLLDLSEVILKNIMEYLSLSDLKNMSRVCSRFFNLTKDRIENTSKICLSEPQTKAQLFKIRNFQRTYKTLSVDELQHLTGILNQLKILKPPKPFYLEVDINSDDRVYLISTLKNIADKFYEMLISINLNFQFEVDEGLLEEIVEADICPQVNKLVYEKKYPELLSKSLLKFKNLKSLSLDCSEELPDLSEVKMSELKELNISGVFSLQSLIKYKGLDSLKIASQLSQAETLEKILLNNKSLRKLNLCIANFDLNESTKILKLVHPLQNLEELSLRTALITKGVSEWMEGNKFLKKLTLHCCDFDTETEVHLDFFTKINDLSWIALNEASQEQFYKSLVYFSSLENLTLYSFVKIDVKMEEIADLNKLSYLFVDNEGFGSLVHNMKAPELRHFVLHCKETSVDLKEVSNNVEFLAENSIKIEKFNFVATKFQYLKEDFMKFLEIVFEKFDNLKEFSIKMEFDENFDEFCEKIQNQKLETAVIRTWTQSVDDKEVMGQKFADKIRIEFDFFENKVDFYFPK